MRINLMHLMHAKRPGVSGPLHLEQLDFDRFISRRLCVPGWLKPLGISR